MKRFSTTCMIQSYHIFNRDFWLDYKALEATISPDLFGDIKVKLMRAGRVPEKYITDKEQFAIKRAEIDTDWKKQSEQAKEEGTRVHEQLQQAITTDPIYCKITFGLPTDTLKVWEPAKFSSEDGIFTEYKMEVPIDDYGMLVGVADVVIKQGNKVKIIDYKTSEKIEKKSRFDMKAKKKKTFSYPLSGIEDCNFNVYTLQLSVYAWMIQQLNPELEIESLEIYHIRDNRLIKIYPVEYWKEVVDKLIHWHVKNARVSEEMQRCQTIYYEDYLQEDPA